MRCTPTLPLTVASIAVGSAAARTRPILARGTTFVGTGCNDTRVCVWVCVCVSVCVCARAYENEKKIHKKRERERERATDKLSA